MNMKNKFSNFPLGKKIIWVVLSLIVISIVVGCEVKKEIAPITPAKTAADVQDAATDIGKEVGQIDTNLTDTSSIDSDLDDLDQDLATI